MPNDQTEDRLRVALPPIDLLRPAPPYEQEGDCKARLEATARLLESVLDDFAITASVAAVKCGPAVTTYEVELARGVRASRVGDLADDIARSMSMSSARVVSMPGRPIIGIELPNLQREPIGMREILQQVEDSAPPLSMVLGKNAFGDPAVADLSQMPHLLVAGTTGSGKSVGLNCMVLSLLYRLRPEECRMIMIDPKMLELSVYQDIPHLLAPVITEADPALRALEWAVEQMDDRYRLMAAAGVRSLDSFNAKARMADADAGHGSLPRIVIVVDELAELMMAGGKKIEFVIQRLAQKARAAGIHIIMATQHPSAEVVTSTIKASLPARIAFRVMSHHASRTILGEPGAEHLLGRGDMLLSMPGESLLRVHGAYVSEEECAAVADYWRAQGAPDYLVSDETGSGQGEFSPESEAEIAYAHAKQLVIESGKASTSWLQRQLRVGYNQAATHIARMEREGIVSRPDHVGRRDVLISEATREGDTPSSPPRRGWWQRTFGA